MSAKERSHSRPRRKVDNDDDDHIPTAAHVGILDSDDLDFMDIVSGKEMSRPTLSTQNSMKGVGRNVPAPVVEKKKKKKKKVQEEEQDMEEEVVGSGGVTPPLPVEPLIAPAKDSAEEKKAVPGSPKKVKKSPSKDSINSATNDKRDLLQQHREHIEAQAREMSAAATQLSGRREAKEPRRRAVSEIEAERAVLDQTLQNFFMESMVFKRKTEYTHLEGEVELQRLCVALKFLLDEKDIRARILEDNQDVTDEVYVGSPTNQPNVTGSLVAATSWHAAMKIENNPLSAEDEDSGSEPSDYHDPNAVAPRTNDAQFSSNAAVAGAMADMHSESAVAARLEAAKHPHGDGNSSMKKRLSFGRIIGIEKSPLTASTRALVMGGKLTEDEAKAAVLNDHTYQGEFGAMYVKHVTSDIGNAMQERLHHIWEDLELENLPPTTTEFESTMFSMTMDYLKTAIKAREHDNPDEHRFLVQVQDIISFFRQLELAPSTFHSGGFLYRIDNLLSVLLFRRKRDHEKEKQLQTLINHEKEEEYNERKEAIRQEQEIRRSCAFKNKKTAAISLSAFVVIAIALGIVIVYTTWRLTALDAIDDSLIFLNSENSERGANFVARFINGPQLSSSMQQAEELRLSTIPNTVYNGLDPGVTSNDPTGEIDSFLVSIVRHSMVKSAFYGTAEGHFVAATRAGLYSHKDFLGTSNAVHILATTINAAGGSSGCIRRYEVDSLGRRMGNGTEVTCGYDPRTRLWYTGAVASAPAPTWTDVYKFVSIETNVVGANFDLGKTYARAFYNNTQLRGVFGSDLDMKDLGNLFKNISMFEDGVMMVCDSRWNVVASSILQVDINPLADSSTNVISTNGLIRYVDKFRAEFPFPTGTQDLNPLLAARLAQFQSGFYHNKEESETANTLFMMSRVFSRFSVAYRSRESVQDFDNVDSDFNQWMLIIVIPTKSYLDFITYSTFVTLIFGLITVFFAGAMGYYSVQMVRGVEEEAQDVESKEFEEERKKSLAEFHRRDTSQQGRMRSMTFNINRSPSTHLGSVSAPNSMRNLRADSRSSLVEEKEMEAQIILEMSIKRHKKRLTGITVCMLLLMGCYLLIWAGWQQSTGLLTKEVSDQLIQEAEERVFQSTQLMLSVPTLMNLLGQNVFARGAWNTSSLVNETHDRHFFALLDSFSHPGDLIAFDSAFWGSASGEYISAQMYNVSSTSLPGWHYSLNYNGSVVNLPGVSTPVSADGIGIRFGAKDKFSPCLTYYASKPVDSQARLLVRDQNRVLEVVPGCVFDPRDADWYKGAAAKAPGKFFWTEPFQFTDQTVGVVVSLPVFNGATLVGVFGVQLRVSKVNAFLSDLQGADPIKGVADPSLRKGTPSSFLINRLNGDLVASSSALDQEVFIEDGAYAGLRSPDTEVAGTVKFLTQITAGLQGLAGKQDHQRPLDAPITGTLPYLPFDGFFGQFDTQLLLSFLICSGVTLITLYLIAVSVTEFRSSVLSKDRAVTSKTQTFLQEISSEAVGRNTLERLMAHIRPFIVEACAHEWRRRIYERDEEHSPPRFDEIREHYYQQAISHIKNSRKGRNVLSMCYLQSRGQDIAKPYDPDSDSRLPVRIYRLYTSRTYEFILFSVLALHIAIAFLEPDSYEDMRANGPSVFTIVVELLCLMVEFADIGANWIIHYRWQTHNFLDPPEKKRVDKIYFVIVSMVFVDWIFGWAFFWSFEYLMPLRPFFMVLRAQGIREAAASFASTVYYARNVFVLFLCIVLTASAMGVILFRNSLATDGPESSFKNYIRAITTVFVYISTGENYTEVVYPIFDISPWYILYFFTYTLVGMFFVLAMVIGMFQDGFQYRRQLKLRETLLFNRVGTVAAFILMDLDGSESLSMEEFEDFLRTLRPQLSRDVVEKMFEKLNEDDDATLDVEEFVNGIEEVIYSKLVLQDDISHRAKWRTTLRVMIYDTDWYQKIMLLIAMSNVWVLSMYGTTSREKELDLMAIGLIFFYTIDMAVKLAAYGFDEYWNYASFHVEKTEEEEDEEDDQEERELMKLTGVVDEKEEEVKKDYGRRESQITVGAHGYQKVTQTRLFQLKTETQLQERAQRTPMSSRSPSNFTFRENEIHPKPHEHMDKKQAMKARMLEHNATNVHRMYANRFELVLTIFSLMALVAVRLGRDTLYFSSDEDSLRFVLTFPILRLFSVIKRTRLLVFTLIKLLPDFISVLAVMFVVFFFYAVLGVFVFKGKWDLLQDDRPAADFETLSGAMITLFQLLVGESWHIVMYAAIRASRGFTVAYYFVSFVSIVTLLFVNTFIGIILHSFQKIFEGLRNRRARRKERERRKAERSKLKRITALAASTPSQAALNLRTGASSTLEMQRMGKNP